LFPFRIKRKKRKKSHNSSKFLSYIAWALALIALVLSSILIGYYLGYSKAQKSSEHSSFKEKQVRKLPSQPKNSKESVNKRLQEVLKKESKSYNSASHEIENESLANPPKVPLKLQMRWR